MVLQEESYKACHWCNKALSRTCEDQFRHCFECGLKRLENLTLVFDPCPICQKSKAKGVKK